MSKKPATKPPAAPAENPQADERAKRLVEVNAVLRFLREEFVQLQRANPLIDKLDLLGSLHRKYEQELDAIITSEEAIDAAR